MGRRLEGFLWILVVLALGAAAGFWRSGARKAPEAALPAPPTSLPASPGRAPPPLSNRAAYLPAQCYAVTQDTPGGRVHNGCFACHQTPRAPNFTDDADVQMVLSVAQSAAENRWTNVLRPPAPVEMPKGALLAWVRTNNYRDEQGRLRLAAALEKPPAAWDGNGNGRWEGYTPDCWFQPDAEGFDRAPDGRLSGWRAFAYAPFPGMFWPTNGSMGDAFLRLPEAFRQDRDGRENTGLYRINLAIVEAFIRRVDVPISPTDEHALGVDLNGDGRLGTAEHVAFVWPPVPGRSFHYVGKAAELDPDQDGWPTAGLYPRGTEFLHSLRYLDVEEGEVRMAARMKELRYMRKTRWLTYGQLQLAAEAEVLEKMRNPSKLKTVLADVERGVGTGTGWLMQGFIEDAAGALRPQTVEETAACIGCHGGVGATTDATFSFARKLDAGKAHAGGWYAWGARGLKGVPEPKRADGQGEYAHWLEQVGGGDDYRSNDEVQARFFRQDGSLQPRAVQALSQDISTLLMPSPRRALLLDRAYLALVKSQRFERGRDVLLGAPPKVHPRLEQEGATGIESPVSPGWQTPGLAVRENGSL
ncbi:hypothetical protein [Stigmatella aurantiaca]|uniref:Conserved uncharacterized protein n=1 Tax=Stigmatella aurantiaca (strain DW4/3-1) TaxID=378806 RepID=Q09AC0_STIAD|nr:hypothetical protein [Stigmatella aurantiaca]ADO75031.1 conserved uncharacterized protein [Stigmatella aurantiaca DW4/3-1]EAU68617.1 conserved hypothetical protein [Stigmatella aurantiaca DW4/3-1]